MTRRLAIAVALVAGLALCGTGTAARAGNLWLTGHDADKHCAKYGEQCHHVGVALDFARTGAPDPTRPLLFLDKEGKTWKFGLRGAAANSEAKAANGVEGRGKEFPSEVVDPSGPRFATLQLSTRTYSAIVIASDATCDNDCNLNVGRGDTPDSDAINKRSKDIADFFNAGGGLVYFAGGDNRDVYYRSVPIPTSALPVQRPFTLTPDGEKVGLNEKEKRDANCCMTHNSFRLPTTRQVLQHILDVAEKDNAGNAETLVGRTIAIEGGALIRPRKNMEGLMDATTLVITFGFLAFMVERVTNGIAIGLGYWPWWRAHMEVSPLADEGARAHAERNRKVALFGLSAVVAIVATLLANLNLLAHVPAFENVPQVAFNIISGFIIAAGADPIREFLNMGDRKEEARHRERSPIQVSGTLVVQQTPSGADGEKDRPPRLSVETSQALGS
jgi:hypothetical protein